jgi:hypothetical protein
LDIAHLDAPLIAAFLDQRPNGPTQHGHDPQQPGAREIPAK